MNEIAPTFLGFKSFGVERIRFKSDQVRQSLMMKSRRVYRCMLKLYSSTFRMVCNTCDDSGTSRRHYEHK
jgi:hypothetical protein